VEYHSTMAELVSMLRGDQAIFLIQHELKKQNLSIYEKALYYLELFVALFADSSYLQTLYGSRYSVSYKKLAEVHQDYFQTRQNFQSRVAFVGQVVAFLVANFKDLMEMVDSLTKE
jgi:hypothetical protein